MRTTEKKVNYYRLALRHGNAYRMTLSEDFFLVGSGGGTFAYLAPVFDSRDYDGTYHRLLLSGTWENCRYEVLAAAVNTDVKAMMEAASGPYEWEQILKKYTFVRKVNTEDFLLHDLRGRYLWVMIQVTAASTQSRFSVEGFQISFPKSSFTEYLPEIYQTGENDFFFRYMAVLQSMYEDLEKEIERIPGCLDYERTSTEYLKLFSGWVGVAQPQIYDQPKQLRYIMRNLQRIQSGKGTGVVLLEMLKLLTGEQAVLVEYFKWHDRMRSRSKLLEDFERLYGQNENVFTVIIEEKRYFSEEEKRAIGRVVEEGTPFGMRCRLVYLRQSSCMDTHCYLDRNSVLASPTPADTSGFLLDGNYILG